jgi:3-hydroxybutyryl-CoA dehydrogenase
MKPIFANVAVIGCGAMGRGIAQLAAQAGSNVRLFDADPEAAQAGIISIVGQWKRLEDKGRIEASQRENWENLLRMAPSLSDLRDCDLIVEAIVESLAVKRSLVQSLTAIVAPTAVLASNTSSLSITAIAAGQAHCERIAGLHFFNPAPLMRVVEVIAGLKTSMDVCDRLSAYVSAFGHTPVRATDTPGFIVNHAGRAFGTEALRIVGENVADFAAVDRILRDQAGFRLGPFELLDLTGLDVSHPVMESIYHQYYEEPRYRPSVITAQRLAGGMLGRKSGQGFYRYSSGKQEVPAEKTQTVGQMPESVWISPRAARRVDLLALVHRLGAKLETSQAPSSTALIVVAPLGFDVSTIVAVEQLDGARTVGIDMLLDDSATKRRVLATNPATNDAARDSAARLFASDGKAVEVVRDSAGFVTQRVLAMIVNIASDICQQGVCSPEDLDTAVQLGLGYPRGPLALGDAVGAANLLEVLFNQQTVYGDPRYRPSPWLRRRAALGLSLLHPEI